MKYKVGNDIIKISRFKNKINNNVFVNAILNDTEQKYYKNLEESNKILFLAKKWTLLECLSKIDEQGIASIKKNRNIILITQKNKKPYVKNINIDISFSHDGGYLFTTVIKEINVS